MAPTAVMDSGHRSRISSTNGTRCTQCAGTPAQPAKNCGEVAMTTSGRRTKGAATVAAAKYETKFSARRTVPALAARYVHTRMVRMPSIHSSCRSWLR